MSFILWSYHIRNNSVEKLQSITWDNSQWSELLQKKLKGISIKEVFVLNTCNRIEVLAYHEKPLEMIPQLISGYNSVVYSDLKEIIHHLLEVSLSMDSMVFGENQILGQIKEAFILQEKDAHVGLKLSKLLQLILREAKLIRSTTALSQIQTSVSEVAAKWVQKKFKDKNTSMLLVGFGETNQLVLKYLDSKGYSNISLTNRTATKISRLPYHKVDWLDFLSANLRQTDILFFSTASQKELLTPEMLQVLKPKVVVDICLPANASAKLVTQNGAQYIGLDFLQEVMRGYEEDAKLLKNQLGDEIAKTVRTVFLEMSLNSLNMFISQSVQQTEKIQEDAQKDLDSFMNNLTDDQKEALLHWSNKLVKKLNHYHLTSYKEAFRIGLKSNGPQEDSENRNA